MPDSTKIEELRSILPYKNTEKTDGSGEKKLIYQEFSRKYSTNFRTVTLDGSMDILLNLKVTPGATLYYSVNKSEEVKVNDDEIDAEGNVTLEVKISLFTVHIGRNRKVSSD